MSFSEHKSKFWISGHSGVNSAGSYTHVTKNTTLGHDRVGTQITIIFFVPKLQRHLKYLLFRAKLNHNKLFFFPAVRRVLKSTSTQL